MILKAAGCKRFMKTLFIGLLFISTASVSSYAADIKDYLDELVYAESQEQAVHIEMYRYLGWYSEDKEAVKAASKQAIKDLNEIENHLLSMDTSKEETNLTKLYIKVIESIKKVYSGIESKDAEAISLEVNASQEVIKEYQAAFGEALMKCQPGLKLPVDFNPADEELKAAGSQENKLAYKKALSLMDEKDFKQAYPILLDLKNKTANPAFRACVLLRIADCLLTIDGMEDFEGGLSALSDLVDENRYSPVVYESFLKWRTVEQSFNHGMSNASDIPNKEYNEKKWQLVRTIKEYLRDNSADIWAQGQLGLLLSLPNITRGGTFGNSNLSHYAALYSSFDED